LQGVSFRGHGVVSIRIMAVAGVADRAGYSPSPDGGLKAAVELLHVGQSGAVDANQAMPIRRVPPWDGGSAGRGVRLT
jgi:hypothetical protein